MSALLKRHRGKAVLLTITLVMFVLCTAAELAVVRADDLNEYLWGDRTVTAENIPYGYAGVRVGDWVIVVPRFYPLPKVETDGETVESLFLALTALPFGETQKDPNRVVETGGDCQAMSVYLRTALCRMGMEAGYLPYADHVCVWAVVDGAPYKLDAVTNEFARMSQKDQEYLRGVIGGREWMD